MARDDLHFRLRIPENLKERVEIAAQKNFRSMTAEIIATLSEKYPDNDPKVRDIVEKLERFNTSIVKPDMVVQAFEKINAIVDEDLLKYSCTENDE